MKSKWITVLLVGALLAPIQPARAADKSNPYGTLQVDPAGPNEIIFSITKGSARSEFTLGRMLKMKSKTITIYEPFVKKRQSFTVIPIKSFFAFVGAGGKDTVQTRALNDYIYANTAANFLGANTYVAIQRDGQDIPYNQGGPIRLVFDSKSKWSKNLDAWNWSLSTMVVK